MTDLQKLRGQRVLVRADLDVAVDARGRVARSAEWRLQKATASIIWLRKRGAATLIIGHRGRPLEKDKKFTLAPMARYLQKRLRTPVQFFHDIDEAAVRAPHLAPGAISMLENLRFYPEEKKNDTAFARTLAALGDVYINDAFASSHRAHASVVAITKFIPSYAGLQFIREVAALEKVLRHPAHPLVAVIGGIKMETKVPIIKNVLRAGAAHVLLGGGVATTFFAAHGFTLGSSIVNKEFIAMAKKLLKDPRIVLPVDVVIARTGHGRSSRLASLANAHTLCSSKEAIMDIGPATARTFKEILATAKTIVWNGPVGQFETKPFDRGTKGIARIIAGRVKGRAYGVAGGGETVQALTEIGLIKNIDHVSTGGGAMLEFLAGKKLPGIEALR